MPRVASLPANGTVIIRGMAEVVDLLLWRAWWRYEPGTDVFSGLYHGFNLIEGVAWLGFASAVLWRWLRHRRSWLEPAYAAAFVGFALTDFREAYVVQGWLIAAKGMNLAALLYLRHLVMRRHYPASRVY
jgi:hypothetical protein